MHTITDLRGMYLSGQKRVADVVEASLALIEARDQEIHAYVDVYDDVRAEAARLDALIRDQGEGAPILAGIPVAMKGNILVRGKRATASSKILEHYSAPYHATVSERLIRAGAVMVGSTNMDEFAMGSSTENSAFGPTKNPLDLSRVPGGSSGGSAAAVAMGSVPIALGTDTGGSVRGPASFCGLVGLKPTYGAVSRYGLIAMGSSLDQAGPLTLNVADAETVFRVIRGRDPYDATSWDPDAYPVVEQKETYRIGVPHGFLGGLSPDVRSLFDRAVEALRGQGHTIVDIALPMQEKGLAAYYVVMPAEVSSNLARYDGMRFGLHRDGTDLVGDYLETRAQGFGPEVKRRILLGTYVLSSGYYDAYYGTAQRVRELMRGELRERFSEVDIILTPTTPTPAFKLGEKSDPLSMYLEDIYTVSANLTGIPALSVPAGTVEREGVHLPVGIQFAAPHNGEDRLFDIAKRYRGE